MLIFALSIFLSPVSPVAQAAAGNAGIYTRLHEADQALRATWARLIRQAMESGKTPYEISRYFKKAGTEEVQALKFLPPFERLPTTVASAGKNAFLLREGDQAHRVEVLRVYPDLVVQIGKRVVDFPMTDKKRFNEALRKWLKECQNGSWAASTTPFWGWPSLIAEADAIWQFAAGLALGAVAGSARSSYRSESVVYNFVVDTSGIEARLDDIDNTLKAIQDTNAALAEVEIPNQTMELAGHVEGDEGADNEDRSVAKDLRSRGRKQAQEIIGKVYGPVLNDLKYYVGKKSKVKLGECRARASGSYSTVQGSDKQVPISVQRLAEGPAKDKRVIKVGDFTMSVAFLKDDEGKKFGPYNEAVGRVELCRGGRCKGLEVGEDQEKVNLDDYLNLEVRKRVWKPFDTKALEAAVKSITEKAEAQRSAPSCEEKFKEKYPFNKKYFAGQCLGGDDYVRPWHIKEAVDRWTVRGQKTAVRRWFSDGWDDAYDLCLYAGLDKMGGQEAVKSALAKGQEAEKELASCNENGWGRGAYFFSDDLESLVKALQTFQETLKSGKAVENAQAAVKLARALRAVTNNSNVNDESFPLKKTYDEEVRAPLAALQKAVDDMDEHTLDAAEVLAVSAEHAMCCPANYCRGRLPEIRKERAEDDAPDSSRVD